MQRWVYLGLGWLMIGLGLIGIVLPGLPTTVFIILAAFFFARSSPALHAKLLAHRRFGPVLRDWEARGAIPRRAKAWAVGSMAAILMLSLVLGLPAWVIGVQVVGMGAGAAYILTRPD
ncbi:YbaN family protein [Pseudoroseicyclus sp. CXY001]|uniref:YbaN family protein n=1 Tax=Pseudoroseicyclus sp. CXY001 TaxID=3242492 RepID=UPI0035715DAB